MGKKKRKEAGLPVSKAEDFVNDAFEIADGIDENVARGHMEEVAPDTYKLTEEGIAYAQMRFKQEPAMWAFQANLLLEDTLLGSAPRKVKATRNLLNDMLGEMVRLHAILKEHGIDPVIDPVDWPPPEMRG